jgi:tetratricopeptide (TPR) repeat protein/CHAT domain-containing protein
VLYAVAVLLFGGGLLQATPGPQPAADPALRDAVNRFFAAQQAEDIDGYLDVWSTTVRRPSPQMLKYIFNAGDDVFSEIELTKVTLVGEQARVRVRALRDRTERPRSAGAEQVTRMTRMDVSLTFVREGGDWKLISEGPASDYLAASLLETPDIDERRKLLEAQPELLTEQLILSISRRATEAAQMGNYAAAQTGYERMLEVAQHIGHRKYEAEALQSLGNAYYFQRNLPAALDAFEQRLAIERERGDDEGAAAAYGGIATIRYSFAEYGAALSAYREALAIQERLEDEAGMATTLISTGNVLYLQGDFDGAVAEYRRSRELYRKTSNPAGEARALEGLGRVLLARGDYAGALAAFTGVLEEGRARQDRRLQGSAALNLGDAHFRLGNLDVARTTFEESRAHFEATADAANVGRVWQAVALTDLVAGRYALAEEEYKKSSDSCASASDQECAAGAAVGLGFAQTAQDKFADGIASYRRAIAAFTALKKVEPAARAQIGLSQALAGSGDLKGALAAAAEARHAAVGLDNDDVLWRALVAEARALRRLGERDAALAAARAAAGALQRQVDTARIQPARPVPRDSSAVFAILALLQAETGDAAGAFGAVERMRVHDLRLSLAGAEREIARGMTDAEREEERSIAVELVTLHAQLSRETGLPKPDTERIARLERTISDATSRRKAHEQQLFERLPELRVWRGLIDPAASSDSDAVLIDPGDLLLQFVVDDEDLLIVAAWRSEQAVELSAHVRGVTRKALAERIGRLVQPDVLRDEASWRKASAELLDAVPEAVVAALAASKHVIVVPHEILWRVPFAALPMGTGYLSDTVRVRFAQSLSALVRIPSRQVQATSEAATLLIATSPEIHESVRARVAQTAPGWTLRSPESAMLEAKAVSRDVLVDRVTTLAGVEATEAGLRGHLPSAHLIHLAVPFRINAGSALFSPLLLAGAPPGAEEPPSSRKTVDDASLDPREAMNLQLAARAIVLSDGSAMARRDAADDAPVVHWAWRAAGVPALLMPRWPHESGAANDFLADFHSRLRKGDAPDAALHEAQRALRRMEGRAAPYYWAGWLLLTIP